VNEKRNRANLVVVLEDKKLEEEPQHQLAHDPLSDRFAGPQAEELVSQQDRQELDQRLFERAEVGRTAGDVCLQVR